MKRKICFLILSICFVFGKVAHADSPSFSTAINDNYPWYVFIVTGVSLVLITLVLFVLVVKIKRWISKERENSKVDKNLNSPIGNEIRKRPSLLNNPKHFFGMLLVFNLIIVVCFYFFSDIIFKPPYSALGKEYLYNCVKNHPDSYYTMGSDFLCGRLFVEYLSRVVLAFYLLQVINIFCISTYGALSYFFYSKKSGTDLIYFGIFLFIITIIIVYNVLIVLLEYNFYHCESASIPSCVFLNMLKIMGH